MEIIIKRKVKRVTSEAAQKRVIPSSINQLVYFLTNFSTEKSEMNYFQSAVFQITFCYNTLLGLTHADVVAQRKSVQCTLQYNIY